MAFTCGKAMNGGLAPMAQQRFNHSVVPLNMEPKE